MKVWTDHTRFTAHRPVVTIGMFDGVHQGHRKLLGKTLEKAAELRGESVVITFSPHPRLVLSKEPAKLRFLTSLEEKQFLLEQMGIDHLVVIPFTPELAGLSSCDFMEDILVKSIGLEHLVIGFNHSFGRKGTSDFETISHCSVKHGFSLDREEAFLAGDRPVSSSRIRELLQEGEVKKAAGLLGYQYFLQGTIGEGKKIGRTIGFPTANIFPDYPHKMIPDCGVYAVQLCFDNQILPGMLNIGYRPTVNKGEDLLTIEAHIFDFQDNIYNKPVSLMFIERMREELKFGSVEELKAQLVKDRQQARMILENVHL